MKMNNIDVYGIQTKDFTFTMKADIFFKNANLKTGTIKGSFLSNELYLLNETKGVYKAVSKEYIICDIKKEEEYDDYYDFIRIVYECNNLIELEEYYKENTDKCNEYAISKVTDIMERIAEAIEENKKEQLHYYELECRNKFHSKEKEVRFYLENNITKEYIGIISDSNGLCLEIEDFTFNNDKSFTEQIFEIILNAKELTDKIKKIKNGYIFDDEYFEDKESLIYYLEENYKKDLQKGE